MGELVKAATEHALVWSNGKATVNEASAMLTSLQFEFDDRVFSPLARAPWLDESPGEDVRWGDVPEHVRVLGGEFVCVPFGVVGRPMPVASDWEEAFTRAGAPRTDADHGWAANASWDVSSPADGAITCRIDYPESSPISSLQRRLLGVDGEATLELELEVTARRAIRVAFGVHPILRLPEQPLSLLLEVEFARGATYPGPTESGRAVTTPGNYFEHLGAVPADGGKVDLRALPLGALDSTPVDDVLLLTGVSSAIRATYLEEQVTLVIDWNHDLLPSVNVWYSDRGLSEFPWSSRYRGLGMEPVISAFDLGNEISTAPNPLTDRGIPTALEITPDLPIVLKYRMSAVTMADSNCATTGRQ